MMPSPAALEQLGNVNDLDQALAEVNPRSIKGCLIMGAVFAILAIFASIVLMSSPLAY